MAEPGLGRYGVRSRFAHPTGIPADYSFEAYRLLQPQDDKLSVAKWAVYMAAKPQCPDAELWIQAYHRTLQHHHPDQTVIDVSATAEAARTAWAKSHPSPRQPDAIGPGTDAGPRNNPGGGTGLAAAAPELAVAWIEAEPEQYRQLLRKYGAHPDEPGGTALNAELKALQDAGFTGAELETRAQVLEDKYFPTNREAEDDEPDVPVEIEWEAKGWP